MRTKYISIVNISVISAILLFSTFFVTYLIRAKQNIQTSAQALTKSCSLYDENTALPAGFGSPMNIFTDFTKDPAKKTVDAYCNNGTVTAIIKNPSSTLFKDYIS